MPPGEKVSDITDSVEYYNGKFLNSRGKNIHCYYWKPSVNIRGLLHISHGYTEHCSMYEELAKEMAKRGFFVFAHDHVGHGHSDGCRAFISNLHDLVEDSVTHIQMIRKDYPNLPLFICGHSMGGALAVLTSLEKDVELNGIALIAPCLAPNPETATFVRVTAAKLLGKIFPHFPVTATDFSLTCQNEKKVEEMYQDPLRYKGYWKVRPVLSLLGATDEIANRVGEVKVPFLLLHGDSDKICHIDGSKSFYEKSTVADKTFHVYKGGYHSLLNEPDEIADDVFDRTVKWLDARV